MSLAPSAACFATCGRTLTTGQRLEWPQLASPAAAQPASLVVTTTTTTTTVAPVEDNRYVGEQDLAEFKWTIDQNGRPKGASDWEPMMEKQWPGCTYTAWRRTLPNGKSEYKSVTLSGAPLHQQANTSSSGQQGLQASLAASNRA